MPILMSSILGLFLRRAETTLTRRWAPGFEESNFDSVEDLGISSGYILPLKICICFV